MKKLPCLLIIMLCSSSAFWFACQKETLDPDCPDPVISNTVHLAGFFDGKQAMLYVTSEDAEPVLRELEAEPAPGGKYVMIVQNTQGLQFSQVFDLAIEPDNNGIVKIANAADAAPELIQNIESNGVSYRIYKNAECGAVEAGFTSACYGPLKRPDGSTYTTHNEWYALSHCKAGTGYCTEVKKVIGVRKDFDLANCAGAPIRLENYYGYTCK